MTLKEIAKQAGVSVSTVSRVVNGNAPKAARKDVQDKIWKIARSGGYVPNESAQALRRKEQGEKNTKSIACVHARMADAQNDAFFSTLTRSIEQAAMKVGYGVRFSFSAFDIEEEATRRLILNHDVDGAAVLGRCDKKTMNFLREHFSKVVYAGLNELDTKCDQVICDGRAAALDVMEHLRKLGHSRIGYVGDTKNEIRYLAYREALKGWGISYLRELVANAGGTSEAGYQGAARILARTRDVTALFCMNDVTAIGAMKAIREAGKRVPEDISVIGIDDIEVARYVSPMLTTVRIPIRDMGYIAVKTLVDRIEGGHALPMKVTLPHQLVERESCGYNPGRFARLPR